MRVFAAAQHFGFNILLTNFATEIREILWISILLHGQTICHFLAFSKHFYLVGVLILDGAEWSIKDHFVHGRLFLRLGYCTSGIMRIPMFVIHVISLCLDGVYLQLILVVLFFTVFIFALTVSRVSTVEAWSILLLDIEWSVDLIGVNC